MKKLLCIAMSLIMAITLLAGTSFAAELNIDNDEDLKKIMDYRIELLRQGYSGEELEEMVYLYTLGDRNAKFKEVYSMIDWDGNYDDESILVVVKRTDKALTVNDFPLLNLVEIEEIYSKPRIFKFTLAEAGKDKVREAIEILGANYEIVEYAEPNYFFELCVWEPDNTLSNPWSDLDYETEVVPYLGDIDLDQKVTVLDAIMYVEYVTGHCTLSEIQLIYADVNEDGEYNILDAIAIAQQIVA